MSLSKARLRPFFVPLLLAYLSSSFAAQAAEVALPTVTRDATNVRLQAQKLTLPNGLEVILHQDHSLPRVAINIWYRVGPVNQPKGRSGFAHLFEHLMFEGSKHAGREFDHLLEAAGATNVNGTTSWDRTNFFETLPSEYLELGLWLESDRMGFLLDVINQERLDVQREVVLNERRQSYENAPYGASYLALVNAIYPEGHPFHDAAIGSVADIQAATLADVEDFFRRFYSPSNATLTLAGDFDVDRATALIKRYFGTLPSQPALPRPAPPCSLVRTPNCRVDFPVRLPKAQTLTVKDAVSLPEIAVAWATPAAFSDDDLALDLASVILADGKTSRLYKALVIDQRLASSVSAWVDSTSTDSMFQVSAMGTFAGDHQKLEQSLLSELEKLRRDGPTELEVARAQHKLLLSTLSDLQLLNGSGGESGRAGTLQRLNHYLGSPTHLQAWLTRVGELTKTDILRALQKHAGPEHRVIVRTVPNSTPPNPTPAKGGTP